MGSLFGLIKSFVYTVIILCILQIKVSGLSLEDHLWTQIRSPLVTNHINKVAQGGVLIIKDTWSAALKLVGLAGSEQFVQQNNGNPIKGRVDFTPTRSESYKTSTGSEETPNY
jgi:hypothetical protein